jgi:glutamate N-acetyltransferase/amino-acid N-acetyltransferase
LSVTLAEGFVATGLAAGIKAGGRRDMSLLATDDGKPVPAAAVFTQNKFRAPPVEASLERLNVSGGLAAGVVVNSGNANAGTGAKGRADAEAMCAAAADTVGCDPRDMLVCSTGLIGFRLPMRKILTAIPRLGEALGRDGHRDAAKGILTTDTRPKEAQVVRDGYAIGGMAKGCGMLAPNMATMLAFLTTDAELSPEELKPILFRAADATFNALITDGATSTNDTVMLFASGRKGRPADLARFEDDVRQVCEQLMLQMARDAEGMTKLVIVNVTGAANDAEARKVARSIGNNQLIKCSWYGGDAYWGRLLAEAGSCGVEFDTESSAVSYGGIKIADAGMEILHDAEAVRTHMKGEEIDILVDLGLGDGKSRAISVDLGPGYIKENAATS